MQSRVVPGSSQNINVFRWLVRVIYLLKYSLNTPSFNTHTRIYERKRASVCSCRTFWSISHLALSGIPSRLHCMTLEMSCILGSNPHRYVDAWSTQLLSSLGTLLVWVGYVVVAGKPVPEVDSLLLWWFIISECLLHSLVPVGKEYC